jgi:uncharacterized protein (DUF885 family)
MKKINPQAVICILFLLAACSGPMQPTPASTFIPSATTVPPTITSIPPTIAVATPTAQPPTELAPSPTPEPTATSLPPTTPDPRSGIEITASLEGLPLEEFFEESYRQLLLRSPEMITNLGLAARNGMRNDRLDDLSTAFIRETQALERGILDLLHTYDRDSLSPEMQISYDVYEWYLDNQVRGHEFMYHNYPFHHFYGSYHARLIELFTNLHPLQTRQDIEDYITRLSLVDAQVDQLLEGIKVREEMGVVIPKFIVDLTKIELSQYLGTYKLDPESVDIQRLDVYSTLKGALGKMDGLSDEEVQAYQEAAFEAIRTSYVPAFMKLFAYLNEVASIATNDAGVWKLPDGDDYYAYMLRKETSTDLTPTEVHAIGLAEVARVQEEMRTALTELGYSEEEDLSTILAAVARDGGFISGSGMLTETRALLDEAERVMEEIFSLRPKMELAIVGTSIPPASYEPGSLDGTRPGAFHLPVGAGDLPRYILATMAYHEAIPGHYYQIEISREMGLPLFQTEILYNAYLEGWALYAERLAWEVGLYENNPYGNIGRLQSELMRAIRLVVDTGIHALGWTREEALAYSAEVLGSPSSYEIDRFVVIPAQATGYAIGMIEILGLRQKAMEQLGDKFDFSEFHQVLIGNGAMPLDILERVVDDYIEAELNSG